MIIECRAQQLEDDKGQRFVAPFPEGVTKAVQYGNRLNTHTVYLSRYQLLPYKRIQHYFTDQCQIPLSEGSLYKFNRKAYEQLADFEQLSKAHLTQADYAHADETGINITGCSYGHFSYPRA